MEKAIIRKRAKKFQLVDSVLHYKEFSKADNSLKLRQVTIYNYVVLPQPYTMLL